MAQTFRNGMGCQLSPFGTHNTAELCGSSTNCSASWRCARDVAGGGEEDVYGVFHPIGSPIIAADGLYGTESECKCYTCDPDGGGCVATTDGSNGAHAEETCSSACYYEYVANADGLCVQVSSSGNGVSEEACQFEQFAKNSGGPHGGRFGCFQNFATRHNVCVGIPIDGPNGRRGDETIYTDPMCQTVQCNPLSGVWRLNKGTKIPFTFSNGVPAADGYIWYHSSEMDNVLPVISVALLDEIVGDKRVIKLKASGRNALLRADGSYDYQNMWTSTGSDGATWDNPAAAIISTMPANTDCFEVDFVDLRRFCGVDDCFVRGSGSRLWMTLTRQ